MRLRRAAVSAAALSSGIRPITASVQRERYLDNLFEKESSYSTDVCTSVIAIAGSPDYRYLHENNADDMDIFDQGEEFVCELSSGITIPIRGTEEQHQSMISLLHEGRLISSEMTIGIADNMIKLNGGEGVVSETTIGIADNMIKPNGEEEAVYLPPGEIILAPRNDRRKKRRRTRQMLKGDRGDGPNYSDVDGRNLQNRYQPVYEGEKPILVVRVKDSTGAVHEDDAATMSDNVFGTGDDITNAKSQFAECSFGKFQMTHDYSVDISQHLSAPGVIDVDISIPLLGSDRLAVRTEVVKETQSKLGFELPGPFHHVMFVIEQCLTDCGWAAYAYVNSWLSLYQGDNYKYVSVQMHEIGHNLNMAHSGGLDGLTYTDHTCLMGNPFYDDEKGIICWNPAKNFQIARTGSWYNENSYDTVVWNSNQQAYWSGKIIGVADYKNNPNASPIVVKIESGEASDLYVGFNRAKGINIDMKQARDHVTVIRQGGDGLGYSQSYLIANLTQTESHVTANWRDSGVDMTIHVKEINLDANPGYADVLITFGDASTEPSPTPKPSSSPTPLPTSTPTRGPSQSPSCGNSICDGGEDSSNCSVDCSDRELETTFDYRLGSRGSMFTIEAERNILISSLAFNSNSRGEGGVKVYTRKGGYSGHERSSEGWELIYDNPTVTHARRGQPTYLGTFQQGVTVTGGTSQSFFVTSTKGLVYQAGTNEGTTFASDESLAILVGIGTGATFSDEIYSPRVWGGRIRYNVVASSETCGDSICGLDEGFNSCPADCAGRELETTFEFSLGSSGNMFKIDALRDISISSLVINAMSRGRGAVKVYTRAGDYAGHERNSRGWELIYDNPILTHNRRGRRTELGGFDNAIFVEGGTTQSFFVTSSKGLVYLSGTAVGAIFASDESMRIYEGVGTTGEFVGEVYSPRVFGGILQYDAHKTTADICGDSECSTDENSNSCPADCASRELETTFEFSLGSSGSMFRIDALRDVSIFSLVINAMSRGKGAVKVFTRAGDYAGHERNSQGWELIYDNPLLTHNRRGHRTELGGFDNAIFVEGGTTQSFFVTSSKGLVYQSGTTIGAIFASDESIQIYEGVGTTGEFVGEVYSPRVFGGVLRYNAL